MRWRKILFWSTLTVTGLIILLLGWLWAGDLGVIKPHVERWVTENTGRQLEIEDLSIDLGPKVIISAKGVTLADAEWTGREHMVSVGQAELIFDLNTLFNPPLIVEEVSLSNATAFLSKRVEGNPNWAIDIASTGDEPQEAEPESDDIPILVRNSLIQNVTVVYEDPVREAPVELAVNSLGQSVRDDDFLLLTSNGSLTGQQYSFRMEAGTWGALLSGENVSFDIEGLFDTISITGRGTIDDLYGPREPTLSFDVEGPNIDDLTEMLGLGDISDGSLTVKGRLETRDKAPMLLTLHGEVGKTELDAKLEFNSLVDFNTIDVDVNASGPNLGAILAIAGITSVREAPFLLVADIERVKERVSVKQARMVFGDTTFDLTANLPRFPSVEEGDILLRVAGPDIARFRYLTGLPGAASGAFSIDLNLAMDAEQRELFDFAIETSHGKLTASGEIKGGDTFLGSYADVDAEVFDVKATLDAWEVDIGDLPADALTVNGSVEYVDGGIRTRRPLDASIGSVDLTAEGLVAIAAGISGTNLLFEATGDQLRYVTNPFTEPQFIPPLPFAVQGHMLVNPGEFRFTDIDGSLGSTTVAGNVSIRPGKRIAGSTIEFAATGDRFEELTAHMPKLRARPGAFELKGKLGFAADSIDLEEIRLDRGAAYLTTNLSIGLPASREFLRFDVEGKSRDIRRVLKSVGKFEPASVPWSLAVSGERNGHELRFDEAQIALADATLAAAGNLKFGGRLERTDFGIVLTVPDMSQLGTLNGRQFSAQPLSFTAKVEGANREIKVDDMVATFGRSHVDGALSYRFGETPYLRVDVTSDGLIFEPLLEPKPLDDYEPEPERKDGRLIPDVAIPFEALAAINGDFNLDIAELQRGPLYLYDVRVAAKLADGILDVDDVTFRARSGYLRARARLDPADGEGEAKLEMIARELALGMAENNRDLQMKGDAAINVVATGNDLRTLIGNLDGIVFFRTTGGEIGKLRFLNALYGDMLDNILSTINPFRKSDPITRFDCVVLPVEIENGITASKPASFVRTDKINITIKSSVDLKSENLDINVRSTPRKILTISAAELVNPYVKIEGTLGRPALAVDEHGVLVTGGVAVATGGLSVLARAAWDRLSRSGDPCKTMFHDGMKALSPQFPDISELESMPERPAAPGAELAQN